MNNLPTPHPETKHPRRLAAFLHPRRTARELAETQADLAAARRANVALYKRYQDAA